MLAEGMELGFEIKKDWGLQLALRNNWERLEEAAADLIEDLEESHKYIVISGTVCKYIKADLTDIHSYRILVREFLKRAHDIKVVRIKELDIIYKEA